MICQEYLDGGKYQDVEGLEEKLEAYKSKWMSCTLSYNMGHLDDKEKYHISPCCTLFLIVDGYAMWVWNFGR